MSHAAPVFHATSSKVGQQVAEQTIQGDQNIYVSSDEPTDDDAFRSLHPGVDEREQKERNSEMQDGTLEWFFKSPQYLSWQDGEHSSILWISGGPGCGKSTLAAGLVDDRLQTTNKRVTCYYFFGDRVETRSANIAVASLLHQLLDKRAALRKHAAAEYLKCDFQHTGGKLASRWHAMWDILYDIALDPLADELVWVLDAIDQCEESDQSRLAESVERFYRKVLKSGAKTIVKFLFTCRFSYSNMEGFAALASLAIKPFHVQLDDDATLEKDIQTVIANECDRLSLELQLGENFWTTTVEQTSLIKALYAIEQRTYLWWKLVAQDFRRLPARKRTRREFLKRIQSLPFDLREAFKTLLDKIPINEQQRSRKFFEIVMGATRALTIWEAWIALEIDHGHESEDDIDVLSDENIRADILNTSGLLVTVDRSNRVHFIHATARDFLSGPPSEDSQVSWNESITFKQINITLARSCVLYLTLRGILETMPWLNVSKFISRHPLLSYAAESWTTHVRNSAEASPEDCLDRVLELCDPQTKRFRILSFLKGGSMHASHQNDLSRVSKSTHRGIRRLFGATYLQLPATALQVLSSEIEIDSLDITQRRNMMWWSVRQANAKLCMELLQREESTAWGFTKDLLLVAASNELLGTEVFPRLFNYRLDAIRDNRLLVAILQNTSCDLEMLHTLLPRFSPHKIDDAIVSAALSHKNAKAVLQQLLEHMPHWAVHKDNAAAVVNCFLGDEATLLRLLLPKEVDRLVPDSLTSDPDVAHRIMAVLLQNPPHLASFEHATWAAAKSETCGYEWMRLLLSHDPSGHLTYAVWLAAIWNQNQGLSILRILLERVSGTVFEFQYAILAAASRSGTQKLGVVKLLLEYWPDLSHECVPHALRDPVDGDRVIELLERAMPEKEILTQIELEEAFDFCVRFGPTSKLQNLALKYPWLVTNEVLLTAVEESYHSPSVFRTLIDHSAGLVITPSILSACAETKDPRRSLLRILLETKRKFVLTPWALQAAILNGDWHNLDLLLTSLPRPVITASVFDALSPVETDSYSKFKDADEYEIFHKLFSALWDDCAASLSIRQMVQNTAFRKVMNAPRIQATFQVCCADIIMSDDAWLRIFKWSHLSGYCDTVLRSDGGNENESGAYFVGLGEQFEEIMLETVDNEALKMRNGRRWRRMTM